jgi:LysM repeat protein
MLTPMNSRVVALGMGALAAVGFVACGSGGGGGTGAATGTTFRIGTPNYQTLLPQVTSTVPPPTNPGDGPGIVPGEQTYIVAAGDYLLKIAHTFCINDVSLIATYNAWEDGMSHFLNVGDTVRIPPGSCKPGSANTTIPEQTTIPGATTTSPLQAGPTYTVQQGDYLGGIAKKVGTTVQAIIDINGWTDGVNHVIYPGQKIKVPPKTG